MANRTLTRSFAGGEISTDLFGRPDHIRFATGAELIRNWNVLPQGTLRRRAGTSWRATAKNQDKKTRLIPFVYNVTQALVLEVGPQFSPNPFGYFRFHIESGPLLHGTLRAFVVEQTVTFSGDTVTSGSAHNLQLNDPVQFTTSGTLPAELAIGQTYYVVNVGSPTTFKVSATVGGVAISYAGGGSGTHKFGFWYQQGDLMNWSSAGPFPNGNYYCIQDHLGGASPTLVNVNWYAQPAGGQLEVPHPYTEAELFKLTLDQSGDVLTFCCNSKPIGELRRLGTLRWVYWNVLLGPTLVAPTRASAVAFRGVGIRVDASSSSPSFLTTTEPHGFVRHDTIYVEGVQTSGGTVIVPNGDYVCGEVVSPSELRLLDVSTKVRQTWSGTYDTANKPGRVYAANPSATVTFDYKITAVDGDNIESVPSPAATCKNNINARGAYNTISWTIVAGAVSYNVYKKQNGIYGLIGKVTAADFVPEQNVTFAGDTLTTPVAHNLRINARVQFTTSGTLPTGASLGVVYYVVNVGSPTTFKVSASEGGAAITFSGGSGAHRVLPETFKDDDIAPSGVTVPIFDGSISGTDYPRAVGRFQQRRVFGGTPSVPNGFWMTRPGTESDMSYHLPLQDDDRISQKAQARDLPEIRHIVALGQMLMLTSSTEFRVTPLNSDAITPTSIAVRPQTYYGCSDVSPLVIGNSALFVSERNQRVYEIGYLPQTEGVIANDISWPAQHLFDGFTIVDSASSKAPWPVQFFVSSTGKLLNLTYAPTENVGAWSQWEIGGGGLVESAAVIPEGTGDSIYLLVRRGASLTIERSRMNRDANLWLDGAVSYSGTATNTLTGYGHLEGQSVVVVSGSNWFTATVSGGSVTLPQAVTSAVGGARYDSRLITMPFAAQIEALAQSRQKNVNKVWVRVQDSGRFNVGAKGKPSVPTTEIAAGATFSGMVPIVQQGTWSDDGQVELSVSDPVPVNITALVMEVSIGG